MKKRIALLIALVLCLSLCACSGGRAEAEEQPTESQETVHAVGEDAEEQPTEPQGTVHVVGEEIETERFRFTLKSAEPATNILVCYGEKADKATFTRAEEFFTPSDSPFKDEDGYVIEGVHGFSLREDSDKVYLYYTLEFEYTGKESYGFANLSFSPTVCYKDYSFESDYFSFYREINGADISQWNNFDADFDAKTTVKALGLEIGYFSGRVEPLSSTVYEIRGVIPIPKAAIDDVEESLFLKLAGESIKVR